MLVPTGDDATVRTAAAPARIDERELRDDERVVAGHQQGEDHDRLEVERRRADLNSSAAGSTALQITLTGRPGAVDEVASESSMVATLQRNVIACQGLGPAPHEVCGG